MEYREITPGPAVGQFIKCYWVLEDSSPSLQTQKIVPDGRAELIINLREPFQQEVNGKWNSQPEVFLVGQITRPFLIRPPGPVHTIGVRFRPDGASRLFGFPLYELTDTAVSLADISQNLFRGLDRLREASSLTEQLTILEQVLLATIGENPDRLISKATRDFEQANGLVGVGEMAKSLGVSFRHFERRFRNVVGISPKLFCRLQRFQKVFRDFEASNANWVDAAIACGYYDQAHLIRDFRQFSGTTPTALLTEEFDLSRRFL
jgi:AraC-like DNA-binding protein